MVSVTNANVKALQEVVLCYLRQSVDDENPKNDDELIDLHKVLSPKLLLSIKLACPAEN